MKILIVGNLDSEVKFSKKPLGDEWTFAVIGMVCAHLWMHSALMTAYSHDSYQQACDFLWTTFSCIAVYICLLIPFQWCHCIYLSLNWMFYCT